MDLKADQMVTVELTSTDEVGNPTPLPGTVTYSVDDPAILNLTDNGDGSGTVAATGALGTATLTGTVTLPDGSTASGVAAIQVIAGNAQTFAIGFGTPEEVTPDV